MSGDTLGDPVERRGVPGGRCSGEDAGTTAAYGRGVDAGPLERFPCRFEEQSLLRVHRQRLTGRDPEEGGVETACVVDEPALVGQVGAVVGGRQVPAAVGGEARDAVGAGGHQLPQVLGRIDAAGVAAAHGHDRDRLVGVRGSGPHGGISERGCSGCLDQRRVQVAGQQGRSRVVEDQRCGKP